MKKSLPKGWAMHAYDDEILWWNGVSVEHDAPVVVAKTPFVPGFFVAKLVGHNDDTDNCAYPIAGPFRSLHAAIAAIALIS
ncbi:MULTISPECIES: hypothetical protein [unclassified Acidovorax]|uniref:hypothetical protein n=1 Tax=unclassified Acidovorax TaxID=2684926 RepID=UPI000B3F8690|nr:MULTISPECIES: hypothetical protein [unclassified Acidovorax]